MNVYLVIALCFIPLILVFPITLISTKLPILKGLLALILGLFSVVPIAFFQYLIVDILPKSNNGILLLFLQTLIFAGLLEEGLKFVIEFLFPSKKLSLKQFMALALIFGITLGCFESVVYYLNCLQRSSQKNADLIYSLIFMRMISSDLIHMLCAGLSAFSVYMIKNKRFFISPIIISILIHGIFDLFVYFQNPIHFFAIAAVLFAAIELRVKYSSAKERLNS